MSILYIGILLYIAIGFHLYTIARHIIKTNGEGLDIDKESVRIVKEHPIVLFFSVVFLYPIFILMTIIK